VLAARGVAFMKSHALSYLVGLVEESEIDSPEYMADRLGCPTPRLPPDRLHAAGRRAARQPSA
jgi:hypothetical protein